MERGIFIFDKNKCVGCQSCMVACTIENSTSTDRPWRTVYNSNPAHNPDLPLFYYSLACNHCENAPCLKNCPAAAFGYHEETGAIVHYEDLCVGCNYCSWVCPFDAPKMNPQKGIIEKCNFCIERLKNGESPACCQLCPVGALDYRKEDFIPDESVFSSPVPVSTGAKIKVVELRKTYPPVMETVSPGLEVKNKIDNSLQIKKEWPLIIFTGLCSISTAFSLSDNHSNNPYPVIILFILTAFFSLLHLGKKLRAWRSVLNIRNSWLSREILFFLFFFTLVTTDLLLTPVPPLVLFLNGTILLFTIDMVYRPVQWKWKMNIHPFHTLQTGISAWLVFSGYFELFSFIISIRIILIMLRILLAERTVRKDYRFLALFQILILVTALILILHTSYLLFGLSLYVVAEFTGRISFYKELRIPRPALFKTI